MNAVADSSTLEVMWSRLNSIADEAAITLIRTSFSTVVRESKDLTCVLFDTRGRSLSQATMSVPSFTGTLPLTMKHFLNRYPAKEWRAGDVVMTNDPWLGSGHLPDINIAVPVFLKRRLVGFAGLVAHATDMGGKTLSATATEIYEEGLRFPVCRLVRAGKWSEDILDLIRTNVRVPDEVVGDLNALVAAAEIAHRRIVDFMKEFELGDLTELADEIQKRAEIAMRTRIKALPRGTFDHTLIMDGFDEPLKIQVALRVVKDRLELDYTGSSPQQRSGINSPWCYTYSYSVFAIKSVLTPEVPNNEGTFRPITVHVPERSLLNPAFPAATGARSTTGHFVVTAVYGALAQIVPERVLAECGAPRPIIVVRGMRDDGRPFSQTLFCMGSMGARPTADGLSCIAYPTNTSVTPVEVVETGVPLRITRKEIIQDSGGAGKYRGGCGQWQEIEFLSEAPVQISVRADRTRNPAKGAAGGAPGSCTQVFLNEKEINPKGITMGQKGDRLRVMTPGSGGYGNPFERDARKVAEDVANGFVSPSAARALYGAKVELEPAKEKRAKAA
jgi:N-methylhydantoinase B